jgi:hypothetical protein
MNEAREFQSVGDDAVGPSLDEILTLLSEVGIPVSIRTLGGGIPVVEGSCDGILFFIMGYLPDGPSDSSSRKVGLLRFTCSFSTADRDGDEMKNLANQWNSKRLFGRLSIDDDGDLTVDHVIVVSKDTKDSIPLAGGLWGRTISEIAATLAMTTPDRILH